LKNGYTKSISVPTEGSIVFRSIVIVLPILLFTLLTSVGAVVRVPLPFTPVPITLQTFFVLLAGLMLGSYRGALSQLLYLLWGISGAPLFAGSAAGIAALPGPTGGYLVGFILAAGLVGRLVQRDAKPSAVLMRVFLCSLVILMCGWLWLLLSHVDGAIRAFRLGVLPFLPGDVIKAFAASGIYLLYRRTVC